ncbi:hypothetical protein CH373_12005 [Leptospira perolatii]|uniref:Uncharacterized protein n=1 Tax=Leptospira perolatii TaxID=2023191 RepID=A0A2M9ZLK7_9LEPT|nr:hypothetical protein [Leptospira perolatii]PJZ70390.1 hypothetical protein CH360_06965 [Leptospira perolatii]PJZ72927.1 hypothetical protein CH373_12005 [Leptospira perolatii]
MGSIRNLLFIGGFVAIFSVLLVVLFWTDDPADSKADKRGEADAVATLLGGGSSRSSGGNGSVGPAGSVFDSDFYKAGKGEYIEQEAKDGQNQDKGDQTDADNPVNPQTGKPYTNEEMDRFHQLKERFPTNSLIPVKMNSAEKEKKKQLELKVSEATRAVLSRTASKEQVSTYYDYMEKQSMDRLEIVAYLVDLQKGSGDEEQEKKLDAIKSSLEKQLEQVQKDKQKAMEQGGN